jgi:hypothetical protein
MTARRTTMTDSQGTVRSGPRNAWWIWLRVAPSLEIPGGRQLAYNVTGVCYLLGGGYLSYRLGELVWYLSILAGLSAVGFGGILLITRHLSRQRALRLSTYRAQTARQTAARTALPAVRSQVADSFADSTQAVRIPVADR